MKEEFEFATAERFCLENDLDPAVIHGEEELELIFKKPLQGYSITSQIEALQIKGVGRFGNAVLSVTHALSIARKIGVREVFIPRWKYAASSFVLGNIRFLKGCDTTKNVLAARFFRIRSLEKLLDVPKPSDAWKQYTKEVLPLFGINTHQVGPTSDKTVHVHIRSGDIFERDVPHPGYGQPPLSFYKKALAEKRGYAVVLVFENYSNPVIWPLIFWMILKRKRFRIQSASVGEDQTELFRARSIIASKGSFLYPVFLASPNLREVTIFNNRIPRLVFQESTAVQNISDIKGEYQEKVLAHWKNSKNQRRMMRRYHARNLDSDA